MQRRLRRVPDWARPLLRAMAVAGRQLDLAVFRALEPPLADWLQVCLDAAVLEVNDTQWRFSHDKLREALLAALAPDEKRRLHRLVGEALEKVHGTTGVHEVALAFHFEQAGDLAKAARLTAQAGTSALRRGALHEAATLLARAEQLEEQAEAPLLERTATMRRLLRAFFGVDRRAECLKIYLKGMALLGRPIPATRAGQMVVLLRETGVELRNRIVGAKVTQDEQERALAKELVSLVKATGDVLFDRLDVAVLAMLFSLHAAEQIGDVESQTNHLSWLGYAAYCLPLHRLGKLYLEQAAGLLQKNPQSASRSDYHPFAGYVHHGEGNWDQSIAAYTVWLNRVIETKDAGFQCLVYCSRSSSYLSAGRLAEALSDGEHCVEIARHIGHTYYLGIGLARCALVTHFRGDAEGAYRLARESQLHMAETRNLPGKLSISCFTALAALRVGQRERALAGLNESLTLMAKTLPPAPQMLDGYCAAFEVALQFFLTPESPAERAGAEKRLRQALYHQLRYAHKFPVAGPRALLTIARILGSRGHPRLAETVFALGLNRAIRRRLPYEQALAHLGLGRLALAGSRSRDQTSRARLHLGAAEKLLLDGGYHLDLPEVRSLLAAVG